MTAYLVLSAELLLLVLLELLLCAWTAAWAWLLWKDGREQRLHEAEIERYGQWPCPNCQTTFGRDVTWVCYARGRSEINIQGEPFVPHVGICCPHCRFLNGFDETGKPQFGRGFYFDLEQWCEALESPDQLIPFAPD